MPNSGVAQGSIFVVYGSNLGPTAPAQASTVPLPLPFEDPVEPLSDILEHIRDIERFLQGMGSCRPAE